MSRRLRLVRLLADGELHSGEALARELGVTRAAIAKQVGALAAWGLQVRRIPRRGYCLESPLDLLDAAGLEVALAAATRARRARLELLPETESTNSALVAMAPPEPGTWLGCLAEFQSAGRGRRGRSWLAPFASGLCLSFGWTLREPPAELAALTLAVGVAALRSLARFEIAGLALKWPNDVLQGDRKIGGILCELRAEAGGPAYAVIGIGLNVRLPSATRAAIVAAGGLAPVDVAEALAPAPCPSRSQLAAALLDELVRMALEFEVHGFAPFLAEWQRADALRDRPVRVIAHAATRDGVARGIDGDGSLRVELGGRLERVSSGEVTLRAVA